MSSVTSILRGIFATAATLGALGLIAIAVMITVDVFVRWLTGRPLLGVFEFASVLLVLVTFLPLGYVLFHDRQLRVDVIYEKAGAKLSSALALLDAAIGLTVFGMLLWLAGEEFQKAYQGRFLLRGMIEIPTWIPVAMILFGTAAATLALLFKLVLSLLRLLGRHIPVASRPDAAVGSD